MDLPKLEFVCDRTGRDVDYVIELTRKYQNGTISDNEKKEWMRGLKGALNASDLNRIESNIASISSILQVEICSCQNNWSARDKPHAEDYERIRNNVKTIRDEWMQLPGILPVPERPLNTYQKWNDIEKILSDIFLVYKNIIGNFYYCDTEVYAGEGIGVL